jgi:hypothetical protein
VNATNPLRTEVGHEVVKCKGLCRLEEGRGSKGNPVGEPVEELASPQRPSRVLPLFDLAQVAAAEEVNVRNVLPLLDWADMSRASLVKDVCLQVRSLTPSFHAQRPTFR